MKVIGLAAVVVVGFLVLGAVAKLLLWAVLIAVVAVIGYGTYRVIARNSDNPTRSLR